MVLCCFRVFFPASPSSHPMRRPAAAAALPLLCPQVDLFMMTPECVVALPALDALRDQLDFHYQRVTQHVVRKPPTSWS